jgi:hypothetical protein
MESPWIYFGIAIAIFGLAILYANLKEKKDKKMKEEKDET